MIRKLKMPGMLTFGCMLMMSCLNAHPPHSTTNGDGKYVYVRGEIRYRNKELIFVEGMTAWDAIEKGGGLMEYHGRIVRVMRGDDLIRLPLDEAQRFKLDAGDIVLVSGQWP
jgi:hypothetical protein